ncbi:MAG TPA: hypothetical protein VGB78_02865 [Thermoplasmata archaeon]
MQVKEMPFEEKLQSVRDYIALTESVVFPLVRRRLGEDVVQELRGMWDKGTHELPDDAGAKDKYEQEYADWINKYATSYDFIRERLGNSGIEELEHEVVEALKRMNASLALSVLGLVRAVSKVRAFRMLKSQLVYKLQVFGSSTISETTRDRLAFDVPTCRILDYPGGEIFCQSGCQVLFPGWMKDQFHIVFEAQRQGKSCKLTIMPE